MKKALVMGGNQFVGKAVCKKFLDLDYEVFAFNRGNRENVEGSIHLQADRNNETELRTILKNLEVDIIVDVSAYEAYQIKLLLHAMKGKFKHYVFISSASVYDSSRTHLVEEKEAVRKNPIWGKYAKHKYLAEQEVISSIGNAEYTIFRPFYIYGIGNNLDRESYIFSRIENDLTVYLPNQGKELIQFIYIEDLVNAVVYSFGNPLFENEIFNIAGEEIFSIENFVRLCAKAMKKEVNIKYVNLQEKKLKARDWFPFRDANLFGSVYKLLNTGFQIQMTLLQGLEKTYAFLKENECLTYPTLHKIELEEKE